jgi:homospermidine synthase
MEVTEIRKKFILDAMLDELQLPISTSESVMHTDDTVTCIVGTFHQQRVYIRLMDQMNVRAMHIAMSVLLKMRQYMSPFNTWSVARERHQNTIIMQGSRKKTVY